jgi:succinoglycan biosynthesis protein ExoV
MSDCPGAEVKTVMIMICAARVLITESLHGAICADAVGVDVPWIATATPAIYAKKWADWTESVGVEYFPRRAGPGSDPRSLDGRMKSWARARVLLAQLLALKRARPMLSDRKNLPAAAGELERVIATFKYEAFAVRQLVVFVFGALACA